MRTVKRIQDIEVGVTIFERKDHLRSRSFRDRFSPHEVTGSTRLSWILDNGEKLDKDNLRVRSDRYLKIYVVDVEAEVFREVDAPAIRARVGRLDDVEKLRQIASIIDYTPTARGE